MSKNKKEEEEEEEEVDESKSKGFCLSFKEYKIHADKYQYCLSGKAHTGKYNKKGEEIVFTAYGYFKTFAGIIEEIRDLELKSCLVASKTMDEAITRVEKMNKEFLIFIEPLRRFENIGRIEDINLKKIL